MHRKNRMIMGVLIVSMAGCAHVAELVSSIMPRTVPPSLSTSGEEDWTGYVLTDAAVCRDHVCIDARGEGRAYMVNGQLLQVGDVWVLGRGPLSVTIANPAIQDSVWTSSPELQPGLWRLEVAITPTAPLQSYGQLERHHPFKGWVLDRYTVFVDARRVMLPNRAPQPTARNQ